jgi:hypothetical protein
VDKGRSGRLCVAGEGSALAIFPLFKLGSTVEFKIADGLMSMWQRACETNRLSRLINVGAWLREGRERVRGEESL